MEVQQGFFPVAQKHSSQQRPDAEQGIGKESQRHMQFKPVGVQNRGQRHVEGGEWKRHQGEQPGQAAGAPGKSRGGAQIPGIEKGDGHEADGSREKGQGILRAYERQPAKSGAPETEIDQLQGQRGNEDRPAEGAEQVKDDSGNEKQFHGGAPVGAVFIPSCNGSAIPPARLLASPLWNRGD
ncbi:hypothetical protein [Geotalea toluenoxydans]|uniref:hypothetical protein n=1 Tax=Geotalea toluenoxydans TaxID=421624 RepID=UPI001FB368DA|nr:hypothetical protein [Geotalea toluenoxydans]